MTIHTKKINIASIYQIISDNFFDLVNYQKLLAAAKYNLSQNMYVTAQAQSINSLILYFQN